MRTKNLLLGLGFVIYGGMVALAIIFNGNLVDAVIDLSIGTIGTILGFIISRKNSKNQI